MHISRWLRVAMVGLLVFSGSLSANECKTNEDEFKGTKSVLLQTPLAISESPAQKFVLYEQNGDVKKYGFAAIFVFDEWRFLGEEAYDIDKTKLDNVVASRDTIRGGSVMESVQILVGKEYLVSHTESGAKIRIYGKKGNADLTISPEMIAEFLACLELSEMD